MIFLMALFMISLTLCMYLIAILLQKKFNTPLLHPAIISSLCIILVLISLGFTYDDYMVGGKVIYQFLNTTVVCLAYPLYIYRKQILSHAKVILASVILGVTINFVTVYAILNLLGFSKEMIATMLPRSITAAVGIQVSEQIGGENSLAIIFIIATGLIGSILGPTIIRIGRFQSTIAKGLSYGNSSHAMGTARVLETDVEAAAYSSIGMILTALLSSIIIPLLILFLY